jgi:signal peptidase I
MARRTKSKFREWVEAIVVAFILFLGIRTFIIQAFHIPSGSMKPTLLVGDHLFVNKFIYRFRKPRRTEIIVFKYPANPKQDYIKRIIGLPGENVEVKDRIVYINGKPFDEPYTIYVDSSRFNRYENFAQRHVPNGSYFVMGDNRDQSLDSRRWGFLPARNIRGKALVVYWSWDLDPTIPWIKFWRKIGEVRWRRIGKVIH